MQHIVSRGHTRPLTEISFVQDGPNRVLLVSAAHGHKGAVWSAKVDTLTRTVAATASGDFTAKLWCVSTGKELHEFKHGHVVKSVDFSHDTLRIATGCQDGLVRVFQTASPSTPPEERKVSESGMNTAITKVLWLGSNGELLVSKRSGDVELWDLRQPGAEGPANVVQMSPAAAILDMELSADQSRLLVTCGRKVVLLDAQSLLVTKEVEMPMPLSFLEEGGTSMHPDGSRFIAGGSDLWLREFDVNTGEVLRTFKGHHGPVRCLRYHPSGGVVASGSEDATIRLWDLQQQQPSTA